MVKMAFLFIKVATTYNILFPHDQIQANWNIPSSLYQYLIIWQNDKPVEIINVDAKIFIVTSNAIDTLLYIKDIDLVTFFFVIMTKVVESVTPYAYSKRRKKPTNLDDLYFC